MKALVSGGTGIVGRFIVDALLNAGHEVAVYGRIPPPEGLFARPVAFVSGDLDPAIDRTEAFRGFGCFAHAAFHHVPGRYRGGEGDDPDGFRRFNRDGAIALFRAAKAAGIARCVFLSSRAVYGDQPPGVSLDEETEPRPDTLYGEVKREAELELAGLSDAGFCGVSLRVTGVYGPGAADKWRPMIDRFLFGGGCPARVATEVHGDDVAAAVLLALHAPAARVSGGVLNVSDIVVDHAEICAIANRVAATGHPLPPRADASALNAMETGRIRALGWKPGGRPLFVATVERNVRELVAARPG